MGVNQMTTKLITQLVVEVEDVKVLDAVTVQTAIDALNEAKRINKAAKAAEDTAKAAVMALLGESKQVVVDGMVKIELVEKSRKGVNRELLETVFPEAYAACGTVSTYEELRVH
jgi:hypothetical protein